MKVNFILFTDGSVRRFHKDQTVSAYGVVVLDCTTKRYTKFGGKLHTDSIVFAEAWAVYRGLQYIHTMCKRRSVKPTVLVVTDSKLNVSILTDYIPNHWDLSDWNHWKKKDGGKVKNQEVYQNILELIVDNGLTVRFMHIKSHLKMNEWHLIDSKAKTIGVDLKKSICKLFMKMNNLADETATELTQQQKEKLQNKNKKENQHVKSSYVKRTAELGHPIPGGIAGNPISLGNRSTRTEI